jgi:hypothetical protein
MGTNKTGFDSWILRGSLVKLKRKCGHDTCRCARGELHETWVLSVKVEGRTQLVSLREEELPLVKNALARYKKERRDTEERIQKSMVKLRAHHKAKRKSSR